MNKARMNKMIVTPVAVALTLAVSAAINDGGILEKKSAIPSKPICIENLQNTVPLLDVQRIVADMRIHSRLPVELNVTNAPIVVQLVETDGKETIALFPEQFLATINVKALGAGCTSHTTVVARIAKEIARTGYYLMGSGYGQDGCLTSSIRSLTELDELDLRDISAESQVHIRGGKKCGVKLVQLMTYRQACRRGIAPAPTNEIQKAIWNDIHRPPEKPIKITYDKAAQKPVVK